MLGSYVNPFALSFNTFQADQEIYLPELRPQIKSGRRVLLLRLGAQLSTGHVLTFVSISVVVSPSTSMAL
ncbi:hypothetical protein GN244_ATG05683 [Phytophthora infestans]|uniref:Uncharacterized protein n=1 Tax=Phytophthora infestans TaxID=4787 RepID=A0A833TKG1_PHYIN|nr:hypothetical protein GN244_ATG05683 [Phytophthora infestans]